MRIAASSGSRTYTGTVTAASEWGGIAERKVVRPALNGSVEELFHETGRSAFLVSPMISHAAAEPLIGGSIGSCHRRDLPAGRPSGRATITTFGPPTSSTRSSTSSAPALSSPSNRPVCGSRARLPRRIRPACKA